MIAKVQISGGGQEDQTVDAYLSESLIDRGGFLPSTIIDALKLTRRGYDLTKYEPHL